MIAPNFGTLDVLGSSGGYPALGLACSGYLLRSGGTAVLLDCGPGVAQELLRASETIGLREIVISHMHPDHMLDLVPLGYALLGEWMRGGRVQPLIVRVPTGGRDVLERLSQIFGHGRWRLPAADRGKGYAALRAHLAEGGDWFFRVFDVVEYAPGDGWKIADVTVHTCPVDHGIIAAGMRIERGDAALAYTGDTRWAPHLFGFAKGVRLLLADAHFSSGNSPGGAHMAPREAGRMAREAGAGRLVLCHLGSPRDADAALREAAEEFAGPIHVASRDRSYPL